MSEQSMRIQKRIRLGTHGENYGSWMSYPIFILFGSFFAVAVLLAVLSFTVFHLMLLGVILAAASIALFVLLLWITWVRWAYAFGGGGLMQKAHRVLLSHLDFDGKGSLLDVGCGSGALSIRAARTWPQAKVTGIDYWAAVYAYSKALCEDNAQREGVAGQCTFLHGDANRLDFPDESFDAVVSNYVYHNITGADKQALLLETLRVLKKGGVFAINDCMRPNLYGDMQAFAAQLRRMGFQEVHLIDSASEIFVSPRRAALLFLGGSQMLVGRK